jgi:hypothetical protein
MGARNQVGIGFSYRPARLHRLAESLPWDRFLGSKKVLKYRLWCPLSLRDDVPMAVVQYLLTEVLESGIDIGDLNKIWMQEQLTWWEAYYWKT